jgi:hypothetical protein
MLRSAGIVDQDWTSDMLGGIPIENVGELKMILLQALHQNIGDLGVVGFVRIVEAVGIPYEVQENL